MNFLPKKYTIKIPKSVQIIYSENQRIIVLLGPFGRKIVKLKIKIVLNTFKNKIYITKFAFLRLSVNKIKKLKSLQGTLISLLRQKILEISILFYKKLKFVGVGYQAFLFDSFLFQVLCLKVGYSHQIYFKLSKKIQFFCFKTTTIFIFGNFYQMINDISAKFRSYKIPEVYKGKGLLYEDEIVILKKGKKI